MCKPARLRVAVVITRAIKTMMIMMTETTAAATTIE
jgi:hypothetical protein